MSPGVVTTLLDYEVIEVNELDEGNISATAENKTNNGKLSWVTLGYKSR